jgi:membrane peptidoglycan carboxypeptidase
MAVAYSALINGGLIIRPQIVERIDFQNWKKIEFKKEVLRRVISKQTSDIMVDILLDSVNNWVAKTWRV